MKTNLLKPLIFIFSLVLLNKTYSQEKINLDDIKLDRSVYIFYGTPPITKTNDEGTDLTTDEFKKSTAPLYSTFTIHKKDASSDCYIIRFQSWSTKKGAFESEQNHIKNLKKAMAYNFIVPVSVSSPYFSASFN